MCHYYRSALASCIVKHKKRAILVWGANTPFRMRFDVVPIIKHDQLTTTRTGRTCRKYVVKLFVGAIISLIRAVRCEMNIEGLSSDSQGFHVFIIIRSRNLSLVLYPRFGPNHFNKSIFPESNRYAKTSGSHTHLRTQHFCICVSNLQHETLVAAQMIRGGCTHAMPISVGALERVHARSSNIE